MRIVILAPVRLFGEGLVHCLHGRQGIVVDALVTDFGALRGAVSRVTEMVLIDVTAGFDAEEVRALAVERPDLKLVALGLREQRDEVVSCGRAGFAAYVPREASLDTLCNALLATVAGRLTCSPEIAGCLMRALFSSAMTSPDATNDNELTRREGDVLRLLGRGLSNKEIARDLDVSVGTVKHHVHSILGKLGVARRAQAMRKFREAPWITVFPVVVQHGLGEPEELLHALVVLLMPVL